jgi:hypothetical protein
MDTISTIIDFKNIIKNEFVIIIAKTHTCGVCSVISEKLVKLLNDYPKVNLYQIYVEDVLEFSGQFLVFTVPTILIFGCEKEILRESRFINFHKISRLLDLYLNDKV